MEKLTIAEAERINGTVVFKAHLKLHAADVAACVSAMAVYFGEDREYWEAVGYLHDYGYEKFPEEHLLHTRWELLAEGVPVEDVRAILSHDYGHRNEVEPKSRAEKSLYMAGELSGTIQAVACMRPNGITDMSIKSFMKRFRSRGFAIKCNRGTILEGCEMFGMDIKEVAEIVVADMKEHAEELQLAGNQV